MRSRVLTVPEVNQAHYQKNFIKQAVCELRFPTLFELDNIKPPTAFAHALRKEYPNYQTINNVNLSSGGVAQANAHSFKSKKNQWAVTLRTSAITLETTNYDNYDDLYKRIDFVLKAAKSVIDTDFFTRIGLRYINAVPFSYDDIGDWVNPELVGVIPKGVYGDLLEFSQRVAGLTDVGGYVFNHGVGNNPETNSQEYILDFDFFCEDMQFDETLNTIDSLHKLEFSMFSWTLGEKARSYLGPSST